MKLKKLLNGFKYKLSPIKRDRIVYMSYNGHYSDNPKLVYEEMVKLSPDLDYIWLVKEEYVNNVPKNVKTLIYDSEEAKKAYSSARLIVDNVYGNKETYLESKKIKDFLIFKMNTFLKHKRNQHVYTTWHATCLKKMQVDQLNSKIIDFSCPDTTMLIGNQYSLDILKHLTFNKIQMKLIGTPRNSVLFDIDPCMIRNKKNSIGLPLDKKIVLFAPTFRTDDFIMTKNIERSGINQLDSIDIEKLLQTLSKKFGGEFVFVCRFHYHVSEAVDWNGIKEKYGDKVINGNLSDETLDYLLCTDILISDVSGIMFDFATTKKPTFIYFPDYYNYVNVERGVYIPIKELPFPSSTTFEGLTSNIVSFSNDSYKRELNKFIERINVVDNKNSAKECAEFILSDSKIMM